MMNYKFGIIKNGNDNSHYRWVRSCENLGVDYKIVDIFSNNWMEQIQDSSIDCFLLRPPGEIEREKILFDERLYIISKILGLKTYPSYEEVAIYENKKLLSSYLEAMEIPHPETTVFLNKKEAMNFVDKNVFPLVGKTSIGASGSGVTIIRNKKEALNYIKKGFSNKGVKTRFGPNRATGHPGQWTKKAAKDPKYFLRKIKSYYNRYKNRQRGYIIFQEYITHDYEWRVVGIGDSYFAHQKIKQGEKASGTKGIDYVKPPEKLLDAIRLLSEKTGFKSMAYDLFEDGQGGYLVNEMQTVFGHVQDYICAVNGKPGRYLYQNKQWIFEEGNFNTNESYDLRLKHAIELIKNEN